MPGYTPEQPAGVERWPFSQPEHMPQAAPEYGGLLPWGMAPGTPVVPYGMGDCKSFLDIPPLASFDDGTTCINPDFNALHVFTLEALGIDPTGLPDRLVPSITIPAGGQGTLIVTAEREENGLGHMLIKDFLIQRTPDNVTSLLVDVKTQQGDRVYMNRNVSSDHVFNNSHLSCCLPCPILLYPNQSLVFSFQNDEAFPVTVRMSVRASRFMPYQDLPLVQDMERCWSNLNATPFWLTFDEDVTVPGAVAGVPGVLQTQMSVPGGGYFLMERRMVTVTSPGAATVFDLNVNVTQGRVGRRFMTGPVNLGAHWAAPTLAVAGFPEGQFVAANACHCPPVAQFVEGNTRLIHDFENTSADAAVVRLTYSGCMYYLGSCPPEKDLDLVRRYGGGGNAYELEKLQRKGERVFLGFFEDNPLFASTEDEGCPPPAQPCPPTSGPGAELPPPRQEIPSPPQSSGPRIVNMFRPSKAWYGPGSTGALPFHLSFGQDEGGKLYVVVRDPNTNQFQNLADPSEVPAWAKQYVHQKNRFASVSGMGSQAGLGASRAPGEWERI